MLPDFPKTAMIFGAGFGRRMRPLTETVPKPLVLIKGKPIIEYTLDNLKESGVKKVVVNIHYQADKLTEYLSTYKGIEIQTIYEEKLLNTGGGLLQALPILGENPVFVINGDIIWQNGNELLLQRLVQNWRDDTKAILTLKEINQAIGYNGNGDFLLSDENEILVNKSKQKPFVFCGIQLLNPNILAGRNIEPFSIIEVYKQQLLGNTLKNIKGLVHDDQWFHIGTPEGVALAEQNILF